MENIGRCPRCRKFLVAEEYESHKCDFRDIGIRDCKEIILDHMTDCGFDKNGDKVTLAWSLNGVLYRLVECKHNPPHRTRPRPDEILHEDKSDEDLPKPSMIRFLNQRVAISWKRLHDGEPKFG